MSGPRRSRPALLVTLGPGQHGHIEDTLRRLRAALRAGDDVAADASLVAALAVYRPRPRIRLTDAERGRR